jgi:Ca2+-binding EF-hand superfamily protein
MKKLPIIAAASALLLAAAVYAAPRDRISKTDTDGNGSVSKTEAMAAADARFAKMDANGDGNINASDREAKLKQRFAEMDGDKNGAISETEFVAGHARKERGDKAMGSEWNRDGERGKHNGRHAGRGGGHGGGMKMLGLADTNNDQAVSKDEFRAAYAANFAKADSNNDGSISTDERKAMRKMMRGDRRGGSSPEA